MFEEYTVYVGVGAIFSYLYMMLTAKKRREKYIRKYIFSLSLKDSFPSKITEGGAEQILEALRSYFIILNQANNAKFFVPSKILLQIWKAFIELEEYDSFSKKAFGFRLVPPLRKNKVKKKTLQNAFKTVWSLAREAENIKDKQSRSLPLIFKLDKMLNIPKGTIYRFKKKNLLKGNNEPLLLK